MARFNRKRDSKEVQKKIFIFCEWQKTEAL